MKRGTMKNLTWKDLEECIEGIRCSVCEGEGKTTVNRSICPHCKGTGVEPGTDLEETLFLKKLQK